MAVRLLARTLRLTSEFVALDSTKIPSPLEGELGEPPLDRADLLLNYEAERSAPSRSGGLPGHMAGLNAPVRP